jgi:purine nucleosidase
MIYDKYGFKVPPEKIIRVITNTDAKNEGDDQFAIVHTMLSPKFNNVGYIGAHFGTKRGNTMEQSCDEIAKIFDLMGFEKEGMIFKGAPHPLKDESSPVDSEGARLIIREAMKDDESPLYVTFMGPLTDLASAYLLEPKIAGRLTAIWIGGGTYPHGRPEYNQDNDINAVNVVMKSEIDLWQVPKNIYEYLPVSFAELDLKVRPCGKIGEYLCDQLMDENAFTPAARRSDFRTGESWVLGDSPVVGLMLYEHRFFFDMTPAPLVDKETSLYLHTGKYRPVRVYNYLDARLILEDFYSKLALFAKNNPDL